ncbi:MAG: hypothetical protein CVU09_16430 [Bacteroidetes bacterium HGW-Bacteroidetes-4]|jgi:RND family efflux transporter MFP subunit|nr:MAG: hypothetical protein CVU09_16430 [Bacteroidetes bacterium HGW-Bacteroidetes-4]
MKSGNLIRFILAGIFFYVIASCKHQADNSTNEHDHAREQAMEHNYEADDAHADHDHEQSADIAHAEHADEHPVKSITWFEDGYELFAELGEPLVNEPVELILHLTRLTDYKPIAEQHIDLSFIGPEKISVHAHSNVKGIFHATITPKQAGEFSLVINFDDKKKSRKITVHPIRVHASHKTFPAHEADEENLITYLKESAWNDDFALHQLKSEPFSRVIKTSGEILPAPGDETIITAMHSGTISLGNKLIEGQKVSKGETISIISSDLIHQNLTNDYLLAKNSFEKAKLDYQRAQDLINEKLISEKEFLETKLNFESTKNTFSNISKFYSDGNETVTAPVAGIIRSVFVSEGQFIKEGTPIATVMQNKRIILKADVPQQYYDLTPGIFEASFKPVYAYELFNTAELNGKRLSYSTALPANSLFTTVNFEFDAHPKIITGSYAEVYLKSATIHDALTIPVSALMEDQGNYFVFLMHDGEHFKKTYVQLGESDGSKVEVLSGLDSGTYVVSKGTYKVYLASLGNSAPAHTHSH